MSWAPFAVRRDGPSSKHGYPGVPEPQRKLGLVGHSMEGPLSAALGELDNLARIASWTFSNPKQGPLLQHFPLGYHTWASGSVKANVNFISCEHEGVAGEALTRSQIDNLVQLIRWASQQDGWEPRRPRGDGDLGASLYEHRECLRFGSAPTACPSNRIPWGIIEMELFKLPTEDEEEDTDMPYPWVRSGDPVPGYKTYIIVGGLKRHVKSREHEEALLATGQIVHPVKLMSLKLLKAVPSAANTPEPDQP